MCRFIDLRAWREVRHSVCFGIVASCLLAVTTARAEDPPAAAAEPKPRVTVSKQTTVVTGPLREDGYVDFLAALNQHASDGVTPQNNAAVGLWEAFGPDGIPPKLRGEFFRLLGIDPPAAEGRYFVTFDDFLQKLPQAQRDENVDYRNQYDQALTQPWDAARHPLLQRWLTANQLPLQKLVSASRRARYYSPYVADGEPALVAAMLPDLMHAREAARALTMRATNQLGQGDVEGAWDDLTAVYRWGRLTGQGDTLVAALVAIAIEGTAHDGARALLAHGKLSAQQCKQMARQLRELPPRPPMVDRIDSAERLMFADAVCSIARDGLQKWKLLSGDPEPLSSAVVSALSRPVIDWDRVLRLGNRWYDRLVAAGRETDVEKQRKMLEDIDAGLKQLSAQSKDPKQWALALLSGRAAKKQISDQFGRNMVGLLLPAISTAMAREHEAQTQSDLTQLAFAAAAYRSEHGKLPEKLADLAPGYLAAVPRDVFTGQPLIYRPEGNRLRIYSVGRNRTDDGGRTREDQPPGDDVVVDRMLAN